MDKAKIKDYITTIAFFGVSSVVAYQAAIMAYVPIEYSLAALVGFGILSQVAADSRVKAKALETQADIDKAQALIALANAKVDELQGQKSSSSSSSTSSSTNGNSGSSSSSDNGWEPNPEDPNGNPE